MVSEDAGNDLYPERSKNSNALKWREFLPVLGCVANWLPLASAA
jgi:hypothetical protein